MTSAERIPGVDIPTFKEQGIDLVIANWRSIVAPPGITPEQKKNLTELVTKMVARRHGKTFSNRKVGRCFLAGDAFDKFLKDEQTRVNNVLKSVGLVKS